MAKEKERKALLERFFRNDEKLYNVGKVAGIEWFNNFDYRFQQDEYFRFGREAKGEAIENLADPDVIDDRTFVDALNDVEPNVGGIHRFVGGHYYFDAKRGDVIFKLEDHRDKVREDAWNSLEETDGRAYYFLKAIIELNREDEWDDAYGGATWVDILAKMRDLGGGHPAPRDVAIIKSCYIYFKTGSKRYPTHTVPPEMMDTIESVLEKYREAHRLPEQK